MREAGITDASLQSGIDFCINRCPYDHCVIAEPVTDTRSTKYIVIKRAVQNLTGRGLSKVEIAERLYISVKTVERYQK